MSVNLFHLSSAWKNAKAGEDFLPDGAHTLIIAHTEVMINGKGTAVLEWTLETESGRRVKKTSYLTENALGMLKRDLKAVGLDPEAIDINRIGEWAACLCGSVIGAEAKSSEKNGKTYHNINFTCMIKPSGNPLPDVAQNRGFQPVEEDQLPF